MIHFFKKNKGKVSCIFCKTNIDLSKTEILETIEESSISCKVEYITCPLCKQKIIIKQKKNKE